MPKVPYAPLPDVAPANAPAPLLNIQTPPDAFGVGIANAVKGLGSTMDQVGGELFQRATAFQQLRNETESTEAVTRYEKEAGLLHANFSSLQGKNAPAVFEQYQSDLDAKRQSIRDGLSNDFARRMYDRNANSIMGRSIFNGAGHAATQNKIAVDGAAKARIEGLKDTIQQNPKDDTVYNDSLAEVDRRVEERGAVQGWSDDQIAQQKALERSGVMRSKIEGNIHTDPLKAQAMFQASRYAMHSTDIEHLEQKIQNGVRGVVQRNVSDAVNKGWAPYMTPRAISRAEGVQEPLTRIIQEAQRAHSELQFTIGGKGGVRTPNEQAALVAQGVSKTLQSDHLSAKAIDIVPVINGKEDYNADYAPYIRAVEEASQRIGIPLKPKSEAFKSWDPGHFALPSDYDVGSAPKRVEEPEQSRIDRGTKYVRDHPLFQDDPYIEDLTKNRIQTDFNRARSVARETNLDNMELTAQGIMDRGDGKPAANIDEFMANAKSKAAFDALRPDQQIAVARRIKTYNDSLKEQTDLATKFRLQGMADDDQNKFLQIDPLDEKLKLSDSDRKAIFSLQQKIRKNPEKDPQVNRALTILSPMINDPDRGIDKKNNPDQFWLFKGALQDALQTEQQRNGGKPVGFDEIQKIGKRLMYGMVTQGWFTQGQEPLFNIGKSLPGGSLQRDVIRSELMKKSPGFVVTDQDIDREAARQAYNKLRAKEKP